MAITPQNNEAFLREVDEELRREELATFGRRWGRWIIVAVVAVLLGFGGWLYWNHHRQAVAGRQGETYAAALRALGEGNTAAAQAPLAELARSDIEGYRALAIFTQADVLLEKDDLKGAAAKFAAVAKDESLPQPFRDLALIRQTAAEYDSLQPQAVIDRLRGLATRESPWFGSAGEMVAVAYLRMNRREEAGKLFGQIAQGQDVPESIRQRAVQMAGVLGVDAVAQAGEAGTK